MITGFEYHTKPLDAFELSCIPHLVRIFKKDLFAGKEKAIKGPELCSRFTVYLQHKEIAPTLSKLKSGKEGKITDIRLRKMCNYIRANGLCFIGATSDGYYRAITGEEEHETIESLCQRANSILYGAKGLVEISKSNTKTTVNFYKENLAQLYNNNS